jgi:hypothetical protein
MPSVLATGDDEGVIKVSLSGSCLNPLLQAYSYVCSCGILDNNNARARTRTILITLRTFCFWKTANNW